MQYIWQMHHKVNNSTSYWALVLIEGLYKLGGGAPNALFLLRYFKNYVAKLTIFDPFLI
jgi:hypothetical protein